MVATNSSALRNQLWLDSLSFLCGSPSPNLKGRVLPSHPEPCRCNPRAVTQRTQLRPDDVLGDRAAAGGRVKAAIGAGDQPPRIAEHPRHLLEPIGDHLGMLDVVGDAVD